MMKFKEEFGMDNSWGIVDPSGVIAILNTNGAGFQPEKDSDQDFDQWTDSLESNKSVSKSIKVPNGYWTKLAHKGVTCFDYDYDSSNYKMVALSNEPITVDDSSFSRKDLVEVKFSILESENILQKMFK